MHRPRHVLLKSLRGQDNRYLSRVSIDDEPGVPLASGNDVYNTIFAKCSFSGESSSFMEIDKCVPIVVNHVAGLLCCDAAAMSRSRITLVFPQCGLAEFELAFVRSLLATCANITIESVVLMDHAMEWMDPVAIDKGTPDGIREIHLLNSYDALNKHLLKISNTLDEFLVVGIHSKSNDNLDIESFPNQSYIEFIDICERASMLDVYLNFRQLRLCCDYFTYDIANEKMIDNDACVVVCQLPWAKVRYNHLHACKSSHIKDIQRC